VKENEDSFDLFENILFVKFSKLNNYSAKTLHKPAIQLTWYLTDSMSCGYLSIHNNQEQKWRQNSSRGKRRHNITYDHWLHTLGAQKPSAHEVGCRWYFSSAGP
jgi:hypothetical protein